VLQGSILGPFLFLLYINYLPNAVKHKAPPILFADNTSVLITIPNSNQLQSDLNVVFAQLNKWFNSNLLFLNFDKTHFIQFNNASKCTSVIEIEYEDEQISIANETNFLGLYINNNLCWKTRTESIKNKLSSACYVMRLVKPYVTANTLKVFYYSYFHSIMTYGLIFCGNSPDSVKIFRLQKKIIRIMMGCRITDTCRKSFLNLEILPLPSQYILSLLLSMIRNKNQFHVNSKIHQTNARQHANLHQPSVNTTKYQRAVHCIAVKVLNMLPFYIKAESGNPKKLKALLQNYLRENSFYSLDEYFELQS